MDIDSHSWVLWVGVFAAALHIIEEYSEGWVTWADFELGQRFGITITEKDFFLGAAATLFITIAGAAIGWWGPVFSLAIPAFFVLNAVVAHMIPSARGDRLTPGTLSAVFIYLPVATWMFWAASEDGQLGFGTFVGAFIIAAGLMAFPLVALILKERIGWDEDTVAAVTAERAAEAARREELARMQAEQELRAATPPMEEPAPAPEEPAVSAPPEDAPVPEPTGETPGELEEDLVEDLDETPDEPGEDETEVLPRD